MPEDTKYIINESQLTAIGNSIRTKLNEQTTYTVDEMPEKIDEIVSGGVSDVSIVNITTTSLTNVRKTDSSESVIGHVSFTETFTNDVLLLYVEIFSDQTTDFLWSSNIILCTSNPDTPVVYGRVFTYKPSDEILISSSTDGAYIKGLSRANSTITLDICARANSGKGKLNSCNLTVYIYKITDPQGIN